MARRKVPEEDYDQLYKLATEHVCRSKDFEALTLTPPADTIPAAFATGGFGAVTTFSVKATTSRELRKTMKRAWYKSCHVSYHFVLKVQLNDIPVLRDLNRTEDNVLKLIEDNLPTRGETFVARQYQRFDTANGRSIGRLFKLYCYGGCTDLCGLMEDEKIFKNLDLRGIMVLLKDVIFGTDYLHNNVRVAHRDLKPENIFLKASGNELRAKIGDFGLSVIIKGNGIVRENYIVGTLWYGHPQMLQKQAYSLVEADIWSSGCIVFDLLNMSRTFSPCRRNDANNIPLPLTNEEKIQEVLRQHKEGVGISEERRKFLTRKSMQDRHEDPEKVRMLEGIIGCGMRMVNVSNRRFRNTAEIIKANFSAEMLTKLEPKPSGWFSCCRQRQRTYVDVLERVLHGELYYEQPEDAGATIGMRKRQKADQGLVMEAMYDFDARNDNELSVYEGDRLLKCEYRLNGVWVYGRLKRSPEKRGLVPANYVKPYVPA